MTNYTDKWRMYGLVNYQLSGIQKAIQFGHAVVEYSLGFQNDPEYQEWAKECKTFIILNGGTTSTVTDENGNFHGSLNNHQSYLWEMGIKHAHFYEPDLGNQLTAVVFLVPEQVYNKNLYPEFWDWDYAKENVEAGVLVAYKFGDYSKMTLQDHDIHSKWVREIMGGEQNYILRDFTKKFKLA